MRLCVGKSFSECEIWDSYGYGSEEYEYIVVKLKDETDLKIANMYAAMREPKEQSWNRFKSEHIGKRILVSIGMNYDERCYIRGTEEQEIKKFKENIKRYFHPKKKEEE